MAWCFRTRASVATLLTTQPCVSRCLRVNTLTPGQNGHHFADLVFKYIFLDETSEFEIKFHRILLLGVKLKINDSGNALTAVWCHSITYSNAVRPLETNLSEIWIKTLLFSRKCIWKFHLYDCGHFVLHYKAATQERIVSWIRLYMLTNWGVNKRLTFYKQHFQVHFRGFKFFNLKEIWFR